VDFPERAAAVAELAQRIKKLEALQEESTTAFFQPKAARRPGLGEEYFKEAGAFIDMLDKLSTRLVQLILFQDAFIDRVMEVKQLAWVVRNAGGDASVMVSNTMGGQPLPADALLIYGCRHADAGRVRRRHGQGQAGLFRERLPGLASQGAEGFDRG
jgi:hypothetical protein